MMTGLHLLLVRGRVSGWVHGSIRWLIYGLIQAMMGGFGVAASAQNQRSCFELFADNSPHRYAFNQEDLNPSHLNPVLTEATVFIHRDQRNTAWQERFAVGSLADFNVAAIHVVSAEPLRRKRLIFLRQKTKMVLGRIAERMEAYGFPAKFLVYLIVESKPKTAKVRVMDKAHNYVWQDRMGIFPGIARATADLGVPDAKGTMFALGELKGELKQDDVADLPQKFLLLSALAGHNHTLYYPFMVAHEWAHLTEPPGQSRHPIWREARADLLAYLATGKKQLRIPMRLARREGLAEYIAPLSPDKSTNSKSEKKRVVLRSLRKPNIPEISKLKAESSAVHLNSQIISSALYKMARKFGDEALADFIMWMDQASLHGLDSPGSSPTELSPSTRAAVSPGDRGRGGADGGLQWHHQQMAVAFHDEMMRVGELLEAWGVDRGVDLALLRIILQKHGLDGGP